MSRGPWKKKDGSEKAFKSAAPAEKKEVKTAQVKASTSGREIIPGAVLAAQTAEEEAKKKALETKEKEGEVLDLTDDEIKELSAILFQESGNLLLRVTRRQLILDQEAKIFGKLSLPKLRQLLKEKMNIGWTAPLVYACLVMVSKPLTPEGEKLKKEAAEKRKLEQEIALANKNKGV